MRTVRFHEESLPTEPGATLEIAGEEAHHAATVLRVRVDSQVELFDGKGGSGTFRVSAVARHGLTVMLVARTDVDREARTPITIAVAPPRPKRLLALIEKATELGVARVVPIETERTRAPLPDKALPKLERRAIEAAKQCGRNKLPSFAKSQTLEQLLAQERADLKLLPDPRGAVELKAAVRDSNARSALFVIGPEGGFTEGERTLLRGGGFSPVVLGASVLRTETAALAILACLRYELG